MLDQKEILRKCCNDTCNQGSIKQCHVVKINNKFLSEKDLKFLSTINVHTLNLSDSILN